MKLSTDGNKPMFCPMTNNTILLVTSSGNILYSPNGNNKIGQILANRFLIASLWVYRELKRTRASERERKKEMVLLSLCNKKSICLTTTTTAMIWLDDGAVVAFITSINISYLFLGVVLARGIENETHTNIEKKKPPLLHPEIDSSQNKYDSTHQKHKIIDSRK